MRAKDEKNRKNKAAADSDIATTTNDVCERQTAQTTARQGKEVANGATK